MSIAWLIFLFLIGACIGSFLNVVIYRLPRGESIVFPGSHCPACGRAIRWYDNMPLLSWFVLRGRCRDCKARISPRYLIVEAITAILVTGLYACYFLIDIRDNAGPFAASWPMYTAHACLLCGLLVCAVVDIESWFVPLEVCWFVSIVGVVASAAAPHPFMARVSPAAGGMSIAAVIGLAISVLLSRYGLLQLSFIDARCHPAGEQAQETPADASNSKKKKPDSVGITKDHGINPRIEILREVLFLAPAIILAVVAYFLVTQVPSIRGMWEWLSVERSPEHGLNGSFAYARNVAGLQAAMFGYLIGGLWIWGTRILGTLAFGREAMGLGDVHILAAVGAVCGWIVPSGTHFPNENSVSCPTAPGWRWAPWWSCSSTIT